MQRKPHNIGRLSVFVGAAVILLGVSAWFVYPYLSFKEMFRRSRPALDAYAQQVTASNSIAIVNPPRRLGYFNVLKVESLPQGFLFQSDFGNPFDWCGIAYSTTPLPHFESNAAGEVKQMFTPIEGNWYDVFRP
jgi:hypothetical protein